MIMRSGYYKFARIENNNDDTCQDFDIKISGN